MGIGTSGDCDGRLSVGEAGNFWSHLEALYPKSVRGTIAGAVLFPEGWDRDNFQLEIGSYSDNTSWNGILRSNNMQTSMGFRPSEARFIDTKADDGSPFTGTIISDNDECVDHDESGAEPTYASNDFGSGTMDESDTDACLSRILVNRWLGRDFGLVTINSASTGSCTSCPLLGQTAPGTTNCGFTGVHVSSTYLMGQTCGYFALTTFLNDSSNTYHIRACGVTTTRPVSALTNSDWVEICKPCNTDADCPNPILYSGSTKARSAQGSACYDGSSSNAAIGYCANSTSRALTCAVLCNSP